MTRAREEGPLGGVRVIDCSIALTGPYALALLADQGADVVKIERPGFGDIARYVGVSVNGTSALFTMCNRGKRSIAIDLHADEGRDVVVRLARDADVFVENYRPGVLERLGLGYEELSGVNDRLVYASLTGFGPIGPYAGKSAYDTVIQAYGGFGANQADPETGEPRFLNQTAADKVTAMYAVQAITAALFARERTSRGQRVEISMLDAVVSFLWADAAGNEVLLDSDRSMKSSFSSNFRPFRFTDGYGVVTPTSDADFAGMCRGFGVDGYDDPRVATIAERARNRDVMQGIMARCYEAAARLSTAEAMQRLEAQRVPCGVVIAPADLPDDPHARAIGLFEESTDPVVGRVRRPRHPSRFSETPAELAGIAPALGQHTDEILDEIGMGGDIARLRAAGAIA
jgi:crotonobetainyl-CoA:carnitine CoA-transferase CaiB-like acyl-CoA transferase